MGFKSLCLRCARVPYGLGFRILWYPIMENEMEKNMENEMEAGF